MPRLSLFAYAAPKNTHSISIFAVLVLLMFALYPMHAAVGCTLSSVSPSVTICNPANGAKVGNSVTVTAGTTDRAHPVTTMILYVDNKIVYKVSASYLSHSVSFSAGKHNITVNAWDKSGAVFKSTVFVTASGTGTAAVSVAIKPSAATLAPGATQQFSVVVLNTNNTAVKWYVDGFSLGNTTVGTITTNGLYTAPQASGTHKVMAISEADSSKSDTAVVTVKTSTKISVSITPISATVRANTGTQQFNANVIGSMDTAVTWSVDGVPGGSTVVGTVSPTGLYAASPINGMYTVTAKSQADPSASASATVFVTGGYCVSSGDCGRRMPCCPPLSCVPIGPGGGICE